MNERKAITRCRLTISHNATVVSGDMDIANVSLTYK
jgi:hypothetical protein